MKQMKHVRIESVGNGVLSGHEASPANPLVAAGGLKQESRS